MKDKVISVKSVGKDRFVKNYMSGAKEVWDLDKPLSYKWSHIGDFEHNDKINSDVALVRLDLNYEISLKDSLIGYINIDGKLCSPLYSEKYDKYFGVYTDKENEEIEQISLVVFNKLLYDSRAYDQRKEESVKKLKLLIGCQ